MTEILTENYLASISTINPDDWRDLVVEQYRAIGRVNIPTREAMGLITSDARAAGQTLYPFRVFRVVAKESK